MVRSRSLVKLQAHLDDLPEKVQDEIGTTHHDVLWPNVGDVATNGSGRVQSECLILLHDRVHG